MFNYYPQNYTWQRLLIRIYVLFLQFTNVWHNDWNFTTRVDTWQGHMRRGSSVMSQVLYSLSFPSQRLKYLSLERHGINLSGVGDKGFLSYSNYVSIIFPDIFSKLSKLKYYGWKWYEIFLFRCQGIGGCVPGKAMCIWCLFPEAKILVDK